MKQRAYFLPSKVRLQYKSISFAFGCSHIPIFPTKMVGFIYIYLIDLVLIVSPYFLFAFHCASDIEISNRRDQNELQTFFRSFRGFATKKILSCRRTLVAKYIQSGVDATSFELHVHRITWHPIGEIIETFIGTTG